MSSPAVWHVRVLGRPSVWRDGQPVALPTQKAAALLVLLAVQREMPRERIAVWLWPGAAGEPEARRNLRRELARLREAGADTLFDATRSGLAFGADVQIDLAALQRAQRSCEASPRTFAESEAQAALALWQGPLADGLQIADTPEFAHWLDAARSRVAAQRAVLLQAVVAFRESRGDTDGALQGLAQLLADDPLQERHQLHAMQLMADAGRREAALAGYETFRRRLLDDLGLEPMAPMQQLAAALHHAPAASAPPFVPASASLAATRSAGELPFVGRDTQLAELDRAWREGKTMLVEGAGGVGKTRLAAGFAASRGAYAWVRCRPGDEALPLGAFTRVLRTLAGDALDAAALPRWVRDELARVLPELDRKEPRASPRIGSDAEQRRFFEACAAAWRLLAAGSFDVVVIDDWHLADRSSQALLAFIARERNERAHADRTVRELFVFRPELPDAARETLRALTDGGCARHIRLAELTAEEILALVQRLTGASEPRRFAARLHQATAGNPFFIAETLRHWQTLGVLAIDEEGRWQTPFDDHTADYRELPLPLSVRDAVLARTERLGDATRRLLDAAALASEPFAPGTLAGACALSEVEALGAIEQALQAQLLVERDGGGFAFAHDLVQMAIESSLAPQRCRLVHRRLALAALAAAEPAARIARHWEAGGEPRRAVPHRLQAAEQARALFAHDVALEHWQAALDDGADASEQLRVHRGRWLAQVRASDAAGLLNSLVALDTLARDRASPHAVALEAAIEAAHLCNLQIRPAEGLARIEACLSHPIDDPRLRSRALEARSTALIGLGRTVEGAAVAEAALQEGGLEPEQQGRLLHGLMCSAFMRGEPAQALAYARRTLELAQAINAPIGVVVAHQSIGTMLVALGDVEAGAAHEALALQSARELHLVDQQRSISINIAQNLLHMGDAQAAIQLANEAHELAPTFARMSHRVSLLSTRSAAQRLAGDLGASLDDAKAAFDLVRAHPGGGALEDTVSMLLDLHTWIGDADGAALLLAALPDESQRNFKSLATKLAFNRIFHAVRFGDLAAARQLANGLGDPDAIAARLDRLSAHAQIARVHLAEGDAALALQALARIDAPVQDTEVRALICRLRLAAQRELGAIDAAALASADAELAMPLQTAFATLALSAERRRAAQALRDQASADALDARINALRARLAASLSRHPREQGLLMQSWTTPVP